MGPVRPLRYSRYDPEPTRQVRIVRVRASSDARMVTLAGEEAQGTWNQLEALMWQWRAIEE